VIFLGLLGGEIMNKNYHHLHQICIFAVVFALLFVSLAVAAESFHGDVKSKIFHNADCRDYNCESCVEIFETRENAIEIGYHPCKKCKP
jgi:hypothetical protein